MLLGSNIKNLLAGSTKDRELKEMRQAWDATQAAWRSSPLAKCDTGDLAFKMVREAFSKANVVPAMPIASASFGALDDLLCLEDLGDLELDWPVISESLLAAVGVRKMMSRRRRWATDYEATLAAFTSSAIGPLATIFRSLPESCVDGAEAQQDTFQVPLLDLVEDPVALVHELFMLPYTDESFRYDLFHKLRELCATNILVASGFMPDADINQHQHKLIRPDEQKGKTGAELAEMYLRGSPLRAIAEVPVPFYIPDTVRFEHCHIVGGTGHGKTQLLQKMIHSDLVKAQEDGRSVIVIDSQGDLINKLMRLELFSPDAPNSLADRLIVVDPSDVEFPAALNLFDTHIERIEDYSPADRERVLNGVVELYELFFGAFLGAELTQKQGVIFRYLARLMLAVPNATIYTLIQIMEDGRPFKLYMDRLDGAARHFFETEFFHPSFAATKKQVIRRLWGVLSTPAFERMFTQRENKLDLFEAMQDGKIILVSTAKDLLKREGSQLLGRFFIAMVMQAALERSTLKEYQRTPTLVYVDEAQEYFDESVETILNQARKYRVGLTLAHQTLDQGSPALRSALLANTSIKCAGGVSARDARALAPELHTTAEFIESMKRRKDRSEFALWVKQQTGQAIRLTVPLGFLERMPTLSEEDFEQLVARNRERYCGTLADIPVFSPAPVSEVQEAPAEMPRATPVAQPDAPPVRPEPVVVPVTPQPNQAEAVEEQLGKGGKNHRYLQSLVKQLAEQQGLHATVEAPIQGGTGQVDVLLERDGVVAAVEISVSTPAEYERMNLRKCLDAGYPCVAVVLAKSKKARANYEAALAEDLPDVERSRVVFLAPEELPDFIEGLAPIPEANERVVRGYRVKGSLSSTSPEDARAKRDALARLIAKSLGRRE